MSILRFNRNNFPELSNFEYSRITYNGICYNSVEAAFQAQKTLNENIRRNIAGMRPGDAKRAGRNVALRPDWENIKFEVMRDLIRLKFRTPEMKKILLATGDAEIVEDTTTWHDNLWGDCLCEKCRNIKGENHLGKILTETREFYRNKE